MKYKFPENLFCDVRIEDSRHTNYYLKNGEPEGNSEITIIGAMIRIFDGKMWYSAETNDLDSIQKKIDELAVLAKPNPAILKNKIIPPKDHHFFFFITSPCSVIFSLRLPSLAVILLFIVLFSSLRSVLLP